eukprot:171695_1
MALTGVTVLEFAGLAPAPFAGMVLSDFGARVVRVDRSASETGDVLGRGKLSIACDLKKPGAVEMIKKIVCKVDVLIEPFRPGTMERLGLGPEVLCMINPRLIYARLTGFGQTGPYASMAGHDINYIAVSGILSKIKRETENPLPPLNLLGDFAAGGMLCAMGILLALQERHRSGKGQVVDSAMIDGTAYLSSFVLNMERAGKWGNPTGRNLLDSGAHFYNVYETKDGKFMAVGAIEPKFYAALLEGLSLNRNDLPRQFDTSSWPRMKKSFGNIFLTKTRDEWQRIFDGTDACCTPIIETSEITTHPHAAARNLLVCTDGLKGCQWEVNPAPRLSRTPGKVVTVNPHPGQHTVQVLQEFGFSTYEIKALEDRRAIICNEKSNSKL